MAFKTGDRIWETATTTGVGDFTLLGAVDDYRPFSDELANADTCWYYAVSRTNPETEWEAGTGTWNTGGTFTRSVVLDGSAGATQVDFTAGIKDVILGLPAKAITPAGAGMMGQAAHTAGQILYPSDATTLTSSAGFTWGTAAGQGLTLASGTATTDVQNINASVTWNAAGVTFEGWKFVITDTASAAGSLALQILGGAAGATNLLTLSKAGAIGSGQGTQALPSLTFAGQTNTGIWNTGAIIEFSASATLTVRMSSGGLFLPAAAGNAVISSGGTFGISSGTAGTAGIDSAFSRISAGLIGVGTGAAGSFAGALKYAYTIAAASANNRMTNQKLLYGATTDAATAVELTTDGAAGSGATNRILVPADTTLSCVVNIAVKQSASASAKQMLRQFVISNNGGTTAIQGTVVTLGTDSGTAGLATVTCTITANDTDDAVKIEVNGLLATNLRYTAHVISTEVLYA